MSNPITPLPNKGTLDTRDLSTYLPMETNPPWEALDPAPLDITTASRSHWAASDIPSFGNTAPPAQQSVFLADTKAKPFTEGALYPTRKTSERFPLHYDSYTPSNVLSDSLAENTSFPSGSDPMTLTRPKTSAWVPLHRRTSAPSQESAGWSEAFRNTKPVRKVSTISQPRFTSTVEQPLSPWAVPNSMSLPEVKPKSFPSTDDQPPSLTAVEWPTLPSACSQKPTQRRKPHPQAMESDYVPFRLRTAEGTHTLADWDKALTASKSAPRPDLKPMRVSSSVNWPIHPWAVKRKLHPEIKPIPFPSTIDSSPQPWAVKQKSLSAVKPPPSPDRRAKGVGERGVGR